MKALQFHHADLRSRFLPDLWRARQFNEGIETGAVTENFMNQVDRSERTASH